MDLHTSALNVLSLCSGIGGVELGLGLATRRPRTVVYVEREAYVAACLVARMEQGLLAKAPIYSDLRSFDGRSWRGVVDLVAGGPPCQPFSSASHGAKVAEDLFEHVVRITRECEAPFAFFENVPEARGRFREVREQLRASGYRTEGPAELAAAGMGAAHKRPRLWLFAYLDSERERLGSLHAEMARIRPVAGFVPWREKPSARVEREAHGIPYRVERARALGNAVVPCVAARAFAELVNRAVGSGL